MPDFPIIDTHLHIWDPRRLSYSWQKGNDLFDRPYLVEDYRRDCGTVDVEAMVFLECYADFDENGGQYIEEIEFVEDEAKRDPRIAAIVPMAPLERGEAVAPMLEEMATRFAVPLDVALTVRDRQQPTAVGGFDSFGANEILWGDRGPRRLSRSRGLRCRQRELFLTTGQGGQGECESEDDLAVSQHRSLHL